MLILERPRTRQPQGFAEVAQKYKPALAVCVTPYGPPYGGNPPARQPIAGTMAWQFLSTSAEYIDTGITPTGSECTVLVVARQSTVASIQIVFSSRSAYNTDGIELVVGQAGSGTSQVRVDTSGTAQQTVTSTIAGLDNNNFHAYLVSWRAGSGADYWVDGVLQATSSALNGTLSSSQPLYIANRGGTVYQCGVALLACWNQKLSPGDAKELSANPWQLFAPQQIIIPTAAAAASSLPTLSASTYVPGSLTSTGWRPRVTAQF